MTWVEILFLTLKNTVHYTLSMAKLNKCSTIVPDYTLMCKKQKQNSDHCNVKRSTWTIFTPFSLSFLLCKTRSLAATRRAARLLLQLLHDNVPQFNYILQERRDGVD